jgi:hypothetical protein
LYAHINKIKKKKEKPNSIRLPTAKDGTIWASKEGQIAPDISYSKIHEFMTQEMKLSQVPVAHTYNPRYSGGSDQEDQGSKPAQANSSQVPI